MNEQKRFSSEEIKQTLIEVHRDNQALWNKWFNQAKTPAQRSDLYRYREGFDAAVFSLAERLHIALFSESGAESGDEKHEESNVVAVEKLDADFFQKPGISCPHCHNPLFRRANRLWHCPVCSINFFSPDESE